VNSTYYIFYSHVRCSSGCAKHSFPLVESLSRVLALYAFRANTRGPVVLRAAWLRAIAFSDGSADEERSPMYYELASPVSAGHKLER
jgi:hypothetical protein